MSWLAARRSQRLARASGRLWLLCQLERLARTQGVSLPAIAEIAQR
ncbi:MAG: hypothetical protein QOC91_373, partial [Solirubrobacteraceae bacterium]|nr:hypothetical protein [Solirubrobacteraceae bacterium]